MANQTLARFGLTLQRNTEADLWARYRRDAIALSSAVDFPSGAMAVRQQHPERIKPELNQRTCNWYLPYFDRATYGGIMTALRLANYLHETDKVQNRFIICGQCNIAAILKSICDVFPLLSNSIVISLDTPEAQNNIPPSDYSVATLWTTAYVLLSVQNTGTKFYLIQDFEPDFYPAGTTSAQAELTYQFGFFGICNTSTLSDIYNSDYSGVSTTLVPSIDTSVFYSSGLERISTPKRLFYYARPGMPRNGFELAANSLRRVKEVMGNDVDIVCAGSDWNPADYRLDGVVRMLGMLPYEKTGDLYRSCHAGLALMMTRHPSYLPFELMACGTLVIANENRWNTWLMKDGENCILAAPTVGSLSAAITRTLRNFEETLDLRIAGLKVIENDHSNWTKSLGRVASFMHSTSSTE